MKEKETIWRLQEDDFYVIAEEHFSHLSDEQVKKIIELAKSKFNIDTWDEWVIAFFECYESDI
jgi:hypothetical protein